MKKVARLQQEDYMRENCRRKNISDQFRYRRKNGSVTKICLCKVMPKKRRWQVTKSPPLYPPLHHLKKQVKKSYDKQFITVTAHKNVQNYYN